MTAGPSMTGYVYDASGTRVAKGSLTSFSCNFAANGFTPTSSYVLGPGGEQVTEYSVSGSTGNYSSTWQHTNAFAGGKLLATYDGTGTNFELGDWLGTKRVEVGTNSNGRHRLRHRLHQPGLWRRPDHRCPARLQRLLLRRHRTPLHRQRTG